MNINTYVWLSLSEKHLISKCSLKRTNRFIRRQENENQNDNNWQKLKQSSYVKPIRPVYTYSCTHSGSKTEPGGLSCGPWVHTIENFSKNLVCINFLILKKPLKASSDPDASFLSG